MSDDQSADTGGAAGEPGPIEATPVAKGPSNAPNDPGAIETTVVTKALPPDFYETAVDPGPIDTVDVTESQKDV
jgi:hypothetical protein